MSQIAKPASPVNIVVKTEINGIEMGVLDDGTPYLSGRSLARLCGAAPSTIINQSEQWAQGKRSNDLARALTNKGITEASLFIPISTPNGVIHAYPDHISMLVLEYYAFGSPTRDKDGRNVALEHYRQLASAQLRLYIYHHTGYTLQPRVPEEWRKFHDRMLLNSVPNGYFSIFREMSELVITAIQNGLIVDEHTIPDISIGRTWSNHWKANKLADTYGEAVEHGHTYPPYFPQAVANKHITAKLYSLHALGEFRIWMQETYLPEKFPNYLAGKVKSKELPAATMKLILAAFDSTAEELPAGPVPLALPPKKTS